MFLRFLIFVILFGIISARNIEHGDDHHPPASGVPCSKEEPSHHHRREVNHAAILNEESPAPIPAKENDNHPNLLRVLLKKRETAEHDSHTATDHDSHKPAPKPGCCG